MQVAVQAENCGLAGGLKEAAGASCLLVSGNIATEPWLLPRFGGLFPCMPQGARKLIKALSLPWVQEARDQGDEAGVRRMLKEADLWLCYNRIGYSK